jgi:hypothetical protein
MFAVAHSRPPWASMIERQIESPIPMPLDLVVKKALNSRSAFSAEILGVRHKSAGTLSPLTAGASSPQDERLVVYDVKLQRPEDGASLRDWLQKNEVVIVASSTRKFRIALLANSPVFNELLGRTEVERFEEYVEPKLFNDRARVLLRMDHVPTQPFPYDGAGELIAVAETGLDHTHPDFAGRFTTAALGRAVAYTDAPGHGLQNNLNLLVQTPSNTKLTGNFQLRMGLQPMDTDNNVEVIRINSPQKGDYLIQITAANLLQSPREYALTVTGDLGTSKLLPF